MDKVDRVAVCGGGVLGAQIAWHSAYRGKRVAVYDVSEAGLDQCRTAHQRLAQTYAEELIAHQKKSMRPRAGYPTQWI
jgi:3-hydroxybutyryl-CoA dehydrogenase